MIHSGRQKNTGPTGRRAPSPASDVPRRAKLTAILGSLIFTVFLCLSVGGGEQVSDTIPTDGVHQVIAPVDGTVSDGDGTLSDGDFHGGDTDAATVEDGSIWAYFESLLRELIFGE